MKVLTEGPPDAKIMIVGEAPGCFTDDVEVLTPVGWRNISSVSTEDLVAQYNDGAIEFVNPVKVIEEHFEGNVVRLDGRIKTRVTKNHRFLLFNKYHNKLLVEEADSLRLKYPEQSFVLSGKKIDGVKIDSNLVKFIVAVQADGSYEKTGIRFEFSKQRKATRLLEILNNLGVNYRVGESNSRGTFRLTVPKNDPVHWYSTMMLEDKVFSYKLLALDAGSLRVFLDELVYWDGSKDSRDSNWRYFEYCSSVEQNIDVVQAIAHLCEYRASKAIHGSTFRSLITEKSRMGVKAINTAQEYYKGLVYCLTVPSSFFLVRANNIVFVTGNSEEDKTGKPFQGYAGQTLNNLLGQAGIARYQCLVTNVARERPPANKISFFFEDKKCTIPKAKLIEWISELKQEIELYKPNIIIALGSIALWALTGEKKISDFRGYVLPCTLVPGRKVLATYHPQAVNYEWKLYFQTVLDLRKALRHSESSAIPESKQLLYPNVSARQFIEYMEMLIEHPEYDKLSVDVETIQPGSHIEELGLSHDPNFGMSVFLLKGRAPALPEKDELMLWQTFARLVEKKKIVMQNGAYDTGVLWHNNHILVEDIWMDTLIAAHICWPELPRDLGFLGSVCLDVKPWKGSSKTQEYNPADAANTLGIAEVLLEEIKRQGSLEQFAFEMNLIPVSLMLQLQGIKVDREKQKELTEKWIAERAKLKALLDEQIGREINFNSSKQMCQLLYVELGLPVQYKRRKSVDEPRTMTVDASALRALSRLVPDNPIFNLIIAYKKADLLVRQFLDIELSPEGKVHTSYNITGASSDDEEDTKKTKRSFGRWSSSASIILPYGSGNLQNIPSEARKMYRADPGWKIVQADYSQAEAVVVAHLTGDQKLIKMFYDSFGLSKTEKKVYDIHKMTIANMLGIDVSQVTAEQRTAGKTIRHATSYSAGPLVLANRLGIKMGDAKKLMELYHKANPNLRMWYQQIQEELKRSRTLVNLLGRKHRFLDRWGDSLFRSAYSYIPQSTVGDLLNLALLKIYHGQKDLPFEINILLQLHDAVYVMTREENVMDLIKYLRSNMLIPLKCNNLEFMIDVDFKVGDSWGESEDVEINWREKDV